jgi:hypothetical protein
MAFTLANPIPQRYTALSSDAKLTAGIPTGAELKETDTGTEFVFNGTAWAPKREKSAIANTAATIGAATGVALAANANRKYALLVNDSDSAIYLNIGAAAALNSGIRLNAQGGSYEMSAAYGNLDTRAINAISSGAGKILLVTEGT